MKKKLLILILFTSISCKSQLFVIEKNILEAKLNDNSKIQEIVFGKPSWIDAPKSLEDRNPYLIISDNNTEVVLEILPEFPRKSGIAFKSLDTGSILDLYGNPFSIIELDFISNLFNLPKPIQNGKDFEINNGFRAPTMLILIKLNEKRFAVVYSIYGPHEAIIFHNIAEVSVDKEMELKYFKYN